MGRGSNATRALVIVTLLLVTQHCQAEKECKKPIPPECAEDCHGDKWFQVTVNGTVDCQKCPSCGPGYELDKECGGEQGSEAHCVCSAGTYFDLEASHCISCRICENTIGDTLCTATNDIICGPCLPGYYHETATPDLCHPCEWLSTQEQERNPQCKNSRISTVKQPVLADVTTLASTTVVPQETSQDHMMSTDGKTIPKDGNKEVSETTSHVTDRKLLQGVTTSSVKELTGGDVFDDESLDEPVDEKEVDDPATISSSDLTLIVCLVILFLLVLLLLGVCGRYYKKRSNKLAERRRQQQVSFRRDCQRDIENAEEAVDSGNSDPNVFINVLDGSARFHSTAWNAANFPGQLERELGMSSENQQFLPYISQTSFETTASDAEGSSAYLLKRKFSEHRSSSSQNWGALRRANYALTSTSSVCDDESDSICELPTPPRSRSLENMEFCQSEDQHGKKAFVNVGVRCPSVEDQSMEDDEGQSINIKDGTGKPVEPEATICMTRGAQTEELPGVAVAGDGAAADVDDNQEQAADDGAAGHGVPTEAQPREIHPAEVSVDVNTHCPNEENQIGKERHCKKRTGKVRKPGETKQTVQVAQEPTQSLQDVADAHVAGATISHNRITNPANNGVESGRRAIDETTRTVDTASPLCVAQQVQHPTHPAAAVAAAVANAAVAAANAVAAAVGGTGQGAVTSNNSGNSHVTPIIKVKGNRNRINYLNHSQQNCISSDDSDTESSDD